MTGFDADGFRRYLWSRGLAGDRETIRWAGTCVRQGIETPEAVDERLGRLLPATRAHYRNALRWWQEYREAAC